MRLKSLVMVLMPVIFGFGCVTLGPRAEQRDQIIIVKVQRNDSLNVIARRYNTTWQSIAGLNRDQLKKGLIEGQELRIRISGPVSSGIDPEAFQGIDEEEDGADDFLPQRKKRGLFFGPRSSDPPQLIIPTPGRVSSHFGKRGRRLHKGIDIVANVGAPIVASADGEVIFSGRQKGYGATLVIDHGEFMTLYAHASKLIARTGDRVRRGEYIAKVGKSGNARGAHLHFELRDQDNKPLDPMRYLENSSVADFQKIGGSPQRVAAVDPEITPKKKRDKNPSRAARGGKGKKRLLYARD